MIANFFKQSKPIVFLILGMLLSIFYFLQLGLKQDLNFSWTSLGVVALKYVFLMLTFIAFELSIKRFEIQKGHSFVSLLFVLFISFIIPDFQLNDEIFAFLFLSLATVRLLNLAHTTLIKQSIFESIFLIGIASFFYKPSIVFLILVLGATLTFTTPKWRYFAVPIIAISTIVILTQMYFLYNYNEIADYTVFIPKLRLNLHFLKLDVTAILLVFWLVGGVFFIYQIIRVKQIRSLYHRQMATFFSVLLGIAILSFYFESSTISGLWLLSLWPFCIYLGDFISRMKKKLWFQISFWLFVLIPISIYIMRITL